MNSFSEKPQNRIHNLFPSSCTRFSIWFLLVFVLPFFYIRLFSLFLDWNRIGSASGFGARHKHGLRKFTTRYCVALGQTRFRAAFFTLLCQFFRLPLPSLARNHANFEHSWVEEFFLLRLLLKTFPETTTTQFCCITWVTAWCLCRCYQFIPGSCLLGNWK